MDIYLAEIKNGLKKTIINISFFIGLLLLSLIVINILDGKINLITKINIFFENAPHLIKGSFGFLKIDSLTVQMKTFLVFITVYSFPILFFAFRCTMNSLEEEEDTGTICFLFDNPISRKFILTYKYIMGIANYGINILVMFIISTFLVVVSYEKGYKVRAFIQMFNIWFALFLIGIFLLTLGTLYAANKKKESDSFSFSFTVFFFINLLAFSPYVIQFIVSILNRTGYNSGSFILFLEKISLIKYMSFVYWCNPVTVYSGSINIILALLSIFLTGLFYLLSYLSYNSREFGE